MATSFNICRSSLFLLFLPPSSHSSVLHAADNFFSLLPPYHQTSGLTSLAYMLYVSVGLLFSSHPSPLPLIPLCSMLLIFFSPASLSLDFRPHVYLPTCYVWVSVFSFPLIPPPFLSFICVPCCWLFFSLLPALHTLPDFRPCCYSPTHYEWVSFHLLTLLPLCHDLADPCSSSSTIQAHPLTTTAGPLARWLLLYAFVWVLSFCM